jgi:N-acylneuraminate cytidylyltransferase
MSVRPLLAVIPARGGSKGLPGKNIRPLGGLPLIAHSIRCAERCPEIDRCIVSTDSEEIAAVARRHGGDVPFMRPAELATDTASLDPVLLHALREAERIDGVRYESVLLFQTSNPGRLPEDVTAACRMLEADESLDGVVACSEPSFNPYFVGVVERAGRLQAAFDAGDFARRQDAPRFLRVNGALYLWRRRWIEQPSTPWLAAPHRALEIPDERAIDIDTQHDFDVAEVMLRSGLVRFPWLDPASSEESK